jgi:hypothetical protein
MVMTSDTASPARLPRMISVLWPALYLLIVTTLSYAWFANWHYDDPFITYRYAANLAGGTGFVYNPGERVLSTTTPLFALMLAGARALGVQDMAALANLIGCASLAAGGLCLWHLGRQYGLPAVSWAGLLLYPTALLVQITLGSETPLYLALCLAAFLFFERRQYNLCAAMCGLAVLTRGDGILVAALISLAFAWQHRRNLLPCIPWRAVAIFALLLLAWAVPAWLYFGNPLPATLGAKRAQGLMAISEGFARGLFTTIFVWFGGLPQHRLEAALALIGLPYLLFGGRRAALPVVWMASYFAAYSALGVTAYYWYYAPLVPGFIVLVGLGMTVLAQAARALAVRLAPASINAPGRLAQATLIVIIGVLAALQFQSSPITASRPDARYAIYRAAGEWLRANTPAGSKAGMLEVGIAGYYAQRPLVDFAGLIQPEVAKQMRSDTTYDDTAIYAADQYRPDYVLLLSGTLGGFHERWVKPNCQLAATLAGGQYNFPTNLDIYACPGR